MALPQPPGAALSPQDFAHGRQLFSACLELVTEFSPKLRQVMLNEMLLLEVRAHETLAAEGSKERPPPDLVSRVRGYLEMRIHGGSRDTLGGVTGLSVPTAA